MYTYVVWIQMNGEHSLRSEYVSKHSFVCIVYPLISFFPLNLHIFSVLRLFFFLNSSERVFGLFYLRYFQCYHDSDLSHCAF